MLALLLASAAGLVVLVGGAAIGGGVRCFYLPVVLSSYLSAVLAVLGVLLVVFKAIIRRQPTFLFWVVPVAFVVGLLYSSALTWSLGGSC